MTTIVVAAVLLVFLAGIVIYNRLIGGRNQVRTAWSDVDVQLQRRHDLIPQLVSAVDQYAKYERATLAALSELRSDAMRTTDVEGKSGVEEKITAGVRKIIALAEDYPDLKANENFLSLQGELVETEDRLQFARRYYNGSVRDYNTLTETVPSNFVADWFRFQQEAFFQKSADEAANVPLLNLASVE